ncbi:MAG: hypothetical protein MUP90_16135 [Gammaproteobacteria bacterium]|nr:hypothetical protein [Gammaproteobacteria bacterium]
MNDTLRRARSRGARTSPTGIWGDPTLATPDKGRQVTEALVEGILAEIEDLRRSSIPGHAQGQ